MQLNQWLLPDALTLALRHAEKPERYALKQMPLRQHAFV